MRKRPLPTGGSTPATPRAGRVLSVGGCHRREALDARGKAALNALAKEREPEPRRGTIECRTVSDRHARLSGLDDVFEQQPSPGQLRLLSGTSPPGRSHPIENDRPVVFLAACSCRLFLRRKGRLDATTRRPPQTTWTSSEHRRSVTTRRPWPPQTWRCAQNAMPFASAPSRYTSTASMARRYTYGPGQRRAP